MSFLQSYTLPNSTSIKRFKESDFALETKDKICIFNEGCNIIYFYNENPDSKRVLGIFKTVAESIVGPTFGACNVLLEREVLNAFIDIYNNKDHPFHWASTRQYPFFIIYRRGYPVNFYDGPGDPVIMSKFFLNVACNNNYHIYNRELNERIRTEMWAEYRERNPINIFTTTKIKKPIIDSSIDIPAVPYTQKKTIEE